MTLVIAKPLTLAKTYVPVDTDAANYAMRVEAADGQPLEDAVFSAINSFVLGCKADGIWNAIKASCILAGARTLSGALVPLVGTAPTNVNFVSGDYDRKTGLVGNGSSKYLNSNRNNNPNNGGDPQNNIAIGIYLSSAPSADSASFFGTAAGGSAPGSEVHAGRYTSSQIFSRARNATRTDTNITGTITGFFGLSRSLSTEYLMRAKGSTATVTQTSSNTYSNLNHYIFARNLSGSSDSYMNGRASFYFIGESLDLALLDARVTDLINAFGAAIP